ncbi:lung seven transmembrane receptor-domain-containing protein, partial [Dimargaris cristalligena]
MRPLSPFGYPVGQRQRAGGLRRRSLLLLVLALYLSATNLAWAHSHSTTPQPFIREAPADSLGPSRVIVARDLEDSTYGVRSADRAPLSDDPDERYHCSSIYGTNTVLGSFRPALVNVSFNTGSSAQVALVVFNWLDQDHLGKPNPASTPANPTPKVFVCTDDAMTLLLCDRSEYGQILVSDPQTTHSPILTRYVDLAAITDAADLTNILSYPVAETGIYCVEAVSFRSPSPESFSGEVQWINPYGNLPAVSYPKIMFYGLMTITYLIVGLLWLVGTIRYWREILPVQNYLSLLLICLLVDFAVEFWFFLHYNTYGSKSLPLTIFLIILSALRNSLSFFMLLLVALGYSVVKPSLGSTMLKCQILAGLQFLFATLYGIATIARLGNSDSELVAFIALLPLAITMATFYLWILIGLSRTVRFLQMRHQHFKLAMYRNIWRLLFFCACIIMLLVLVNIINFVFRNDRKWIVFRWQVQWVLFDGWLNALYTFAFFIILYLWRPTKHNSRYGLEELAGDE